KPTRVGKKLYVLIYQRFAPIRERRAMHGALTACKNLSLKYNCTRSSGIPPLMISRRYTMRFAALTASMFATLACSADFARAHSRILPWGDPPVGAVDVSELPAPDPEAPPPATVANWRCISL